MPDNQRVRLQNVVYAVDILNGEMQDIVVQIGKSNDNITTYKSQIADEQQRIIKLNNQLVTLYIQQIGTFPPSA
jgi:hypothetical protein